jgi:hypothetical protein
MRFQSGATMEGMSLEGWEELAPRKEKGGAKGLREDTGAGVADSGTEGPHDDGGRGRGRR